MVQIFQKSYYRANDVWIDGKRFHLSPLALDDEVTSSALDCDLRGSHKGVIGGLRLRGDAVCRKVYLIDSVLNRLCVIAAAWEGKSLIWRRGNAAAEHEGESKGEGL